MSKLIHSPVWIKEHLCLLIGLALCFYFSYHLLQGQRSVLRLASLENETITLSSLSDNLTSEMLSLERRVKMMRPESLNRDLLEEQARLVLGVKYADEIIVVGY